MPIEFRLRFPLSEVMYWAARYAYADDAEVEAIGAAARNRGWYARDEFLTVARWKSPRSRKRCEENDESHVKTATQLALSASDERQRIEALTRLRGIELPNRVSAPSPRASGPVSDHRLPGLVESRG